MEKEKAGYRVDHAGDILVYIADEPMDLYPPLVGIVMTRYAI